LSLQLGVVGAGRPHPAAKGQVPVALCLRRGGRLLEELSCRFIVGKQEEGPRLFDLDTQAVRTPPCGGKILERQQNRLFLPAEGRYPRSHIRQ
jgi:hypothetical protein